MRAGRRWILASTTAMIAAALVAGHAASAADPFTLVDESIDVGEQAHGIAFDGSKWHIAEIFSNSWRTFDTSFGWRSRP